MSQKFPGGFVTKSPVAPTTTAASGIWTLDQQEQYQKAGTWPTPPMFIEDLFSTYLYAGTGSSLSINNGIDLAGKGGLTWIKSRTSTVFHNLVDTARGNTSYIYSNGTDAQDVLSTRVTSFNSDGFTLGPTVGTNPLNNSGVNYTSWTFRKQPKFFDVVTYTGTGVAGRTVSHNLGSVPGCIIVKRTDVSNNWKVYHRGINSGVNPELYALLLNYTDAAGLDNSFNDTPPTSTVFSVSGSTSVNASGGTYVAYLFAHDAGGFPASGGGSTNGISCGSYTGNGSTNGPTITLGYEPQWILIKRASGGTANWTMFDNMRGIPTGGGDAELRANTSEAETDAAGANQIDLNATGFQLKETYSGINSSGDTYIYIAIRRGPMKTPTDGTTVFNTDISLDNATPSAIAGFVTDMMITSYRDGSNVYPSHFVANRLVGGNKYLLTNTTDAENGGTAFGGWDNMVGSGTSVLQSFPVSNMAWMWKRSPSFFDQVCYKGDGTATRTVTHNLGVVPELIIVKVRNDISLWSVYHASLSFGNGLFLNLDSSTTGNENGFGTPSSTAITVKTNGSNLNYAAYNYVAYLFATCPGVSKIGSYTGTGATQTISCGFASGARFVMIKRTDDVGDWYVWDSARGMVSGTDPSLLLNSTAGEVNANNTYTTTGGFQIVSTAAGINASGGSYIFLAIA